MDVQPLLGLELWASAGVYMCQRKTDPFEHPIDLFTPRSDALA
jgi:hypothetical protein